MANLEWIISKSNKIQYHTHLDKLIVPIRAELSKFNWLVSNLDYMASPKEDWPVDHGYKYFILSNDKFLILADPDNDAQFIWGVFSAIPIELNIIVKEDDVPIADCNPIIWKPGNILHPDAQIEIICFDGSYTMVKFRDEHLSAQFKSYFPEAIELEKFH